MMTENPTPQNLNKEYPTPQALIQEFMRVQHASFDETTEFHILTEYVNQTSKKYQCPIFASKTGKEGSKQVYRCRFGGKERECSVKLG